MKKTALFLSVLLAVTPVLGGCGQPNADEALKTAENTTATETTAVSEEGGLSKVDKNKTYEYRVEEIWCENDGKRIYGEAYIPVTDGKSPLVITSHGLGTNHESGAGYCKRYAERGIAAYTFDFCGGTAEGRENKSDGSSTDMSVMTEVSDLDAIFEAAKSWDFVDSSRVFLQGGSQGGLVSAIEGMRRKDEAAGLILLYPAFSMYDAVHMMFGSYDDIPEEITISSVKLGKAFGVDLWDYDVRDELNEFEKNVLIIQGDEDNLVGVSVAEDAAQRYPNCRLEILEGAGHGFSGEYFDKAADLAINFLFENI